jgi:hypothetical protein
VFASGDSGIVETVTFFILSPSNLASTLLIAVVTVVALAYPALA